MKNESMVIIVNVLSTEILQLKVLLSKVLTLLNTKTAR